MPLSIQQHVSLQDKNTFRLAAQAEYFCEVYNLEELSEAMQFARNKQLLAWVLGAGSNIVLGPYIPGLAINIKIQGIFYQGHQVKVMAGENWHQLVGQTIADGYFGLENLSLIPGLAGAAPVQNIGAYGVELGDRLVSVEVMHIMTGERLTLPSAECDLTYRNSMFRQTCSDLIITAITLALDTLFTPQIEYHDLKQYFATSANEVTAATVRQAVIEIRQRKLPDPAVIGNVGSFFKNPIVSKVELIALQQDHPNLGFQFIAPNLYKLSAAQLIDALGLRGLTSGAAKVSEQQALVIVNQGQATQEEVLMLAGQIREKVRQRFDISLETEPLLIP